MQSTQKAEKQTGRLPAWWKKIRLWLNPSQPPTKLIKWPDIRAPPASNISTSSFGTNKTAFHFSARSNLFITLSGCSAALVVLEKRWSRKHCWYVASLQKDPAKFIKATSQGSIISSSIMRYKKKKEPYRRCHHWLAMMGCSVGGNPDWCSRIGHEDRRRCLRGGRGRGQNELSFSNKWIQAKLFRTHAQEVTYTTPPFQPF